jgi:hypothetical protein
MESYCTSRLYAGQQCIISFHYSHAHRRHIVRPLHYKDPPGKKAEEPRSLNSKN